MDRVLMPMLIQMLVMMMDGNHDDNDVKVWEHLLGADAAG